MGYFRHRIIVTEIPESTLQDRLLAEVHRVRWLKPIGPKATL